MSQNFKTIMIKIDDNLASEAYARYASKSWTGFNLKYFSAITPETVDQYDELSFGTKGNGRELTPTEKACFYSQYLLWKKCSIEQVPLLILEHDAYLKNPTPIKFDGTLMCQMLGQHAMEAVMFNPSFATLLVNYCKNNKIVGPMQTVDHLLGYTRPGSQSRHALPHSRYMGKLSPVKSLLDPNLGTTVQHTSGTTLDRLKEDGDLFHVVDLYRELGDSINWGEEFRHQYGVREIYE